jgi:curved DNA-binding protein
VAGKGGGSVDGHAGDLYIRINIAPHPSFTRQGDDIYLEKEILPSQAILGGIIEVPTLNGTKRIKLPPGSSSGRKIRLKGYGIKHLRGDGSGDLYVKLVIKIPAQLTERQKKLAQELAKEGL